MIISCVDLTVDGGGNPTVEAIFSRRLTAEMFAIYLGYICGYWIILGTNRYIVGILQKYRQYIGKIFDIFSRLIIGITHRCYK